MRRSSSVLAMAEVPYASKGHGDAEAVSGGDDLFVTDRPAGLNDSGGPRVDDGLKPIGERKESIRGGDSAPERQGRLHCAESRGI